MKVTVSRALVNLLTMTTSPMPIHMKHFPATRIRPLRMKLLPLNCHHRLRFLHLTQIIPMTTLRLIVKHPQLWSSYSQVETPAPQSPTTHRVIQTTQRGNCLVTISGHHSARSVTGRSHVGQRCMEQHLLQLPNFLLSLRYVRLINQHFNLLTHHTRLLRSSGFRITMSKTLTRSLTKRSLDTQHSSAGNLLLMVKAWSSITERSYHQSGVSMETLNLCTTLSLLRSVTTLTKHGHAEFSVRCIPGIGGGLYRCVT